jgi:hypothetical protein
MRLYSRTASGWVDIFLGQRVEGVKGQKDFLYEHLLQEAFFVGLGGFYFLG